ncbi:MAG: hypothetical protein HKN84_05805, partial [Gammaproteobacteria bacterium]|nr:hypothetical protein [Gammaproteobacteria bacterium]
MTRIFASALVLVAALSFSATGLAQFGTGTPVDVEEHEAGPAPIRDLTGGWTRLRPEGRFY